MRSLIRVRKNSELASLEGFSTDKYVAVNVAKLWNDTGNFRDFSKRFADDWRHELVHWIIRNYCGNPPRTHFGEEKMLRKFTGERFSEKSYAYYKRKGRIK